MNVVILIAIIASTTVLVLQQRKRKKENEKIMTAISDFATKLQANLQSIQAGITALDTTIQNFKPGSISAEDQATLDGIVAQSAALATAANTMPVPAAPTSPTDPSAPAAPST